MYITYLLGSARIFARWKYTLSKSLSVSPSYGGTVTTVLPLDNSRPKMKGFSAAQFISAIVSSWRPWKGSKLMVNVDLALIYKASNQMASVELVIL